MKYSEIRDLGFQLDEIIFNVTEVNTIWLDNDREIEAMDTFNYDKEIHESHYDKAELMYAVYYRGKGITDLITLEEVQEFFLSGEYLSYVEQA